jgi:hypothetical protein
VDLADVDPGLVSTCVVSVEEPDSEGIFDIKKSFEANTGGITLRG